MKKTLLLALGLGTALAASAASPNYLQEVKSNCAEVNRQKVDMTVHTSAPVAMKVNNVKNVAAVSRIVTKGKAATKCPWYYQVGLFFEGADAEYQSYVMPTFACPPFAEAVMPGFACFCRARRTVSRGRRSNPELTYATALRRFLGRWRCTAPWRIRCGAVFLLVGIAQSYKK